MVSWKEIIRLKIPRDVFTNKKMQIFGHSPYIFILNLKQIFRLSFYISANGDKSWILRFFRHLSYRKILSISWCFSA